MPGDGLRSLNWRAASFLSTFAIMMAPLAHLIQVTCLNQRRHIPHFNCRLNLLLRQKTIIDCSNKNASICIELPALAVKNRRNTGLSSVYVPAPYATAAMTEDDGF